jgi:hypothetical protein
MESQVDRLAQGGATSSALGPQGKPEEGRGLVSCVQPLSVSRAGLADEAPRSDSVALRRLGSAAAAIAPASERPAETLIAAENPSLN